MQQAIPYKSWVPLYTNTKHPLMSSPPSSLSLAQNFNLKEPLEGSRKMVTLVQENAIIVIARRGCCMSHVVKRLLLGLGVNPPVYEIDEHDEISILQELEIIVSNTDYENEGGEIGNEKSVQLPAVFIGGRLFGGLDRVIATHISGELVPILKEAGALWL